MRLLVGALLCFAVAAAVGIGSTWLAVSRGVTIEGLSVGAWTARPKIGTSEIDPYSRAEIERRGELQLALGDGVAFVAQTDDADRPLDGRCDVTVRGITPQARFFTLTLYDPSGKLVGNTINRYGFTSQELIRQSDGSFEVAVGPRARPGNWLPTGGIERYLLLLRLYDTPVGIATKGGRETPMPTVVTGRCQ
jgi:hypothetical protein